MSNAPVCVCKLVCMHMCEYACMDKCRNMRMWFCFCVCIHGYSSQFIGGGGGGGRLSQSVYVCTGMHHVQEYVCAWIHARIGKSVFQEMHTLNIYMF